MAENMTEKKFKRRKNEEKYINYNNIQKLTNNWNYVCCQESSEILSNDRTCNSMEHHTIDKNSNRC